MATFINYVFWVGKGKLEKVQKMTEIKFSELKILHDIEYIILRKWFTENRETIFLLSCSPALSDG